MRGKDTITKLLAGGAVVAIIVGATLGVQKLIEDTDNKTNEPDQSVEQTANIRIGEISDIVEI